jgi:hypothetical protein
MIAISAAVPSMHEEVQKGAEEEQEVGEHAECVGGVLGCQIEAGNREKRHEHPKRR